MTDPLAEVADRVEAIRSTANYALLDEIPPTVALQTISRLAGVIQLRLKALG
jgi:hypothetical protein